MTNPQTPPGGGYIVDGIEVVELSDIDGDFVKEVFQPGTPPPTPTLEATTIEPAKPENLAQLEFFRGLDGKELETIATQCQSIHAVPGTVLLAPGRLNNKVFFVIEGQMRLYLPTGDKRPIAVADVGQSTGARPALVQQPVNHSVVATEISHILTVELPALDECAKRSHIFARRYADLLASYIRNDNCLHVGTHASSGTTRQGYIDQLTLLHNEHWLNTVLPRLVARYGLGDKPLSVTGFAIDNLDQITKKYGVAAGLRVLEIVGHWVLDQTRPTDLVAINKNRRILVFLPDYDLNAARQLANRLKTLVDALPISLPVGEKSAQKKVTLSFGIVQLELGMKETQLLNKTEALIDKSIRLGGDCTSDSLDSP